MRTLPLLAAVVALSFGLLALHPLAEAFSTIRPISSFERLMGEGDARFPPLPPLPAGLDATERADRILHDVTVQGRTPGAWLGLARSFRLDAPALVPAATGSLDAAVSETYAAAGIAPSPQDLAAARSNAARVPLPVQAPLADLLGTVAGAYAEQEVVAKDIQQRLASGYDEARDGVLLHADERDATIARAHRVVDALDLFKAQWDALAPLRLDAPTCLAPVTLTGDCLAYLGGSGADTYACNPAPLPDPILIVDPSGDDTYTCGAGAARPVADGDRPANDLALSVVADYAGNDSFSYVGGPSVVQGSGLLGGLGILAHYNGNDHYLADMTRTGAWTGLLPLNDDGGAQGFGQAGVGVLLDGWGDSLYETHVHSASGDCVFGYAQGWGGAGGVGIASDLWGNNTWLGTGDSNASLASTQCWVGVYNQGSSLSGVGILTNTGGGKAAYLDYDNATWTDMYTQGFGAGGGLGLLYDQGADDTFVAESHATNATVGPSLNCSFGTASPGGVGVLWAEGGNDAFLANTTSDKGAATMVQGAGEFGGDYGLFVHHGGRDDNEAYASATAPGGFAGVFGRGVLDTVGTSIGGPELPPVRVGYSDAGTFVHTGGETDTYVPLITDPVGGTAENNNEWLAGVDR